MDINQNDISVSFSVEKRPEIQELRERIPDIIELDPKFQEDSYLAAFLKTRKFDVKKAEDFVREAVKWRKENGAEKAAKTEYNAELFDCFKVYLDGNTKAGLLAGSLHGGRFKFKETITRFGKEAVIYHWLQLLSKVDTMLHERTLAATKNARNTGEKTEFYLLPPSEKSVLLIDMEGFQFYELLSTESISVVLALVKMAVSYYPILEGTILFINAGRILEIFFKLVRPLLVGSNVDLVVYGFKKEDQWKPLLFKRVDPCELRPGFGGTMDRPE